jgi:hypothetical protein
MYKLQLMDVSSHAPQIAKALLTLETAIERLIEALSHRPATANIGDTRTTSGAIRRACEAYSAIHYDMSDEIGDSVVCLGVIGADSDLVSEHSPSTPRRPHSKHYSLRYSARVTINWSNYAQRCPTKLIFNV